jgi:hypothetical protein
MIEDQQLCGRIAFDGDAEGGQSRDHLLYDLRMTSAQVTVDLDERIVRLRRVADQHVGPDQAPEPVPKGGARRHAVLFVDQEARDAAMPGQ